MAGRIGNGLRMPLEDGGPALDPPRRFPSNFS
jgi:hypothetical protein